MVKKLKKVMLVLGFCIALGAVKKDAKADNIVVVLDPGHGGEALGGNTDELIEKELSLKVAQTMAGELAKYEGITVYLTRNDDVDLSLEDRVKIAKEVNADYFFCLHFNMSAEHTLFGSECWVSAFDSCYTKGYDFATIELEELENLGCFSRGVKTRMGDKGTDYYGIIRMCTKNNIPSVIIEHCYLDNVGDCDVRDNDSWPVSYGIADATAVAKYFGLKSAELGVDYSDYEYVSVGRPDRVMKPDSTPPENLIIESCDIDEETGVATVRFSAVDPESRMTFYTFSFDGGETYQQYLQWPKDESTIETTIQLPNNAPISFVLRVSNNYDLVTDSDVMYLPAVDYLKEDVVEDLDLEEMQLESNQHDNLIRIMKQSPIEKKKSVTILIILFAAGILSSLIAMRFLKK